MGFGKLIGITIAPRSQNRHYTDRMARTHTKVRFLPKGKQKHTEASAANGVEEVLRILEGRCALVILFHLTDWGQALCPALDALLKWVDLRDSLAGQEMSR